ncbi:MAG TPA: amidohydrolase family protein [Flexivirga sp.]|uniref:amidohydrolase family protein n=1 Tax=Flexivirga sp. TaxID=1962927 RepID=UPI002BEAA82A|nr:amidohydrolase family protein [Flexivirga sp.]HWC22752.1 amidohydrolase family protein [Flexivirga sp.]
MPSDFEPTIPGPLEHPTPASYRPPAGACDSHCHVFGPAARFPFTASRTFTPPDVPVSDLMRLHRELGLDRAVIVQSACHGREYDVLVDALRVGDGRHRGVALIGLDTPVSVLEDLHREGVRGIRLQFMPHLGPAPTDDEILQYAALVEPLGWHLEIHVAGNGVLDRFEVINRIPTRVVLDHLGRVDLGDGLDAPAVHGLRQLLDTGNVWLKLSGTYRVSLTGSPYADANKLAAALAAHAPERVVWGTDFPHPNLHGPMPDDGILLDGIPEIVPDETKRHRLLVDNPTELFDFC